MPDQRIEYCVRSLLAAQKSSIQRYKQQSQHRVRTRAPRAQLRYASMSS